MAVSKFPLSVRGRWVTDVTRLTAKSSTIFIATRETTKVYHSLSEVPPPLRRKLDESTRSSQSATILIADRRGREELVRALQGQSTELQPRIAGKIRSRAGSGMRSRLRTCLELLVPVAVGASVWLFIATRF
jgi:hypothetical protein